MHSSRRDPTTAWAKKVVCGEIVSGALMRAAAQRHLDDIAAQQKRGLRWRPEKAAEAAEFFPAVLTVTAGAKAGTPFHLPSYVGFVVGSLFGWYRESGLLRFRECWLELGKGMVKTPLSAAIGLYIMGWRGIPRSEVYAIAKDRNQANVLFGDAVALCRAPIADRPHQSLESIGEVIIRGTGEMSWMIEHPDSGSKFRALANDERISGPKPSMVCADEIHEWPSAAQIELWKAALVKMPNDALLMLTTNTPAADQVMATEMSEFYQSILKRDFEDDSVFSLIARVDETDDPFEDETCWPKALPLLGITYPVENVRNAVRSSRLRIASALATKRLYFGIPVGGSKYWIDLEAWEAVQGRVDPDEHRNDPCYLALDLSQKNDLTALTALWSTSDGHVAKTWYWRPQHNVHDAARADGAQYVEWSAAGLLNLVPGRSIEYEWVAAKIQELCAEQNIQALAFDPAHILEFHKACERIGFKTWVWKEGEAAGEGLKMIVHAQGRAGMHSKQMLWMPRSLGQLEDAILQQQIIIDRSPLTNWCSGNAAIESDAQNNRWFAKKRLRGRIDGVVSLAMAVGLANANLAVEAPPEYRMFVIG
jgi:phage terminase large subunit-like protein